MTQSAFFEPRRISPTGITIVVAIHAAVITTAMLAKMDVIRIPDPPIVLTPIPIPPDPPPNHPDPVKESIKTETTRTETIVDPPRFEDGPTLDTGDSQVIPPFPPPGGDTATITPPPDPVRIDAEFDPRFIDRLKPPYPLAEQRQGVEGTVTLKVLIGADGRVKTAEKVKATSEGFFRAAQRQAMSQWRFRPATLDGKPVESRKLMTLVFKLDA